MAARSSGRAKLRNTMKKLALTKKVTPIPDTDDLGVLWEHFQTTSDFFQSIKIDKEAGFDELEALWHSRRVLFGAVSIATCVFNTLTILTFNLGILWRFVIQGEQAPNIFLLSDYFIRQIVGETGVPSVAVLAILELGLTAGLYAWAVKNLLFMFNPLNSKIEKWHSVANFFFETFPTISTLSMVKLLNYVTPQILTPSLMWALGRLKYRATGSCELGWFLGTRLLCLFAGFDAFLYKFQLIGLEFIFHADTNYVNVDSDLMLTTLLFVNQMLGIVQLGQFTRKRLFVFVFAGEDGKMTEEEDAIKKTWEAMLCCEIYRIHGIFKAFFLWLSFSDADFQRLVLDSKRGGDAGDGTVGQVLKIAAMLDG